MKTRKLWIALCSALLCMALLCGMIAVAEDDIILDIDAANAAEDDLDLELDDGADAFIEDVPDIELDGGALALESNLIQAEPETEDLIDPASNDGETEGEPTEAVPLSFTYNGPVLTKVYDTTRNVFKQNSEGKNTYLITAPKAEDFSVNESELIEGHTNVQINVAHIKKAELFPNPDVGSYTLTWTFGLKGDDATYYTPQPVSLPAEITPREVVITPRAGLTKVYGTKDPVYKADAWLSSDESSPLHQNIGGLPGYAVPLNTADGKTRLTVTNSSYILQEAQQKGTKFFPGWLTRETGEDVGTYRILIGDMKFSDNFSPQTLKDEVFTIKPKDVSESNVSVDAIGDKTYTGKAIKPVPVVKYGDKKLKLGKDFTVSYSNNKKPGKATVTIKGKGNYTGSRKITFKIVLKQTAISKLTPAVGQITVQWKKVSGISGYQVAYSTKSNFSDQVMKTVKGATKTKLVLKGLKSKKTYYVRIRTYKTVDGKTYYSAWSKAKKAKTK